METETNKLVDLVREVVLGPLSRILPKTTTGPPTTFSGNSTANNLNVTGTTHGKRKGRRKGKKKDQANPTDRIKNRSRVGARRDDWMRATALEFRTKNAPEPLGPKRKRRLTLSPAPTMSRAKLRSAGEGSAESQLGKGMKVGMGIGIGRKKKEPGNVGETNAQACSDLFRLPLELRELVYAYVLADGVGDGGGRPLHIVRLEKRRRLAHVQCCLSGPDRGPDKDELRNGAARRGKTKERDHGCWGYTTHLGGYYSRPKEGFSERDGGLLSLLKSCRKVYVPLSFCFTHLLSPFIYLEKRKPTLPCLAPFHKSHNRYSEAIDILYSQNTFDFNHIDTILSLSTTILPRRLHSIHHLHLQWTVRALTWMDSYPPYDESTWLRLCRTLSASPSTLISTSSSSGNIYNDTPHMPGLTNLHITLRAAADSSSFYPGEKKLLDPLRLICQPRVFRVYFPWALREDMVVSLNDAPFALRTPSGEWVGAARVEEE